MIWRFMKRLTAILLGVIAVLLTTLVEGPGAGLLVVVFALIYFIWPSKKGDK